MPDDVKGARPYNAERRRDDARQRRLHVLAAALESITANGYAGMTMPAVAKAAGVSIEFVYKAFGDKAGLVRELVDVTLAGDDEPVPMAQRPEIAALIAEPDAGRVLDRYAAIAAVVNGRAGALLLAIANGADADPRLAEIRQVSRAQRLAGVTAVAADVAGKAQLAVDVNEARDVIWTVTSPEVHEVLVGQRQWSADRYRVFVAQALRAALLPGPASGETRGGGALA